MGEVEPVALVFFGLAIVLASTVGSWVYLRFGLKAPDPVTHLRRWTAPTYVAVGLFELATGFLAFLREERLFWLPVVLGLALIIGGGYYLGRRTFS